MKQQKRIQKTAAKKSGDYGSGGGRNFAETLGDEGTVYLTAPLLQNLVASRGLSLESLLISRSRGAFWSRNQDKVVLPVNHLNGSDAADAEPHDAYLSALSAPENREQLLESAEPSSAGPVRNTLQCSDGDCSFRVRIESFPERLEDWREVPVLLHLVEAVQCSFCLENALHGLELPNGAILCAHCGDPIAEGEREAEVETETEAETAED
ncbi:MAG: hypothetical protein HY303_21100 [Candidatus Wallbacteria bacterium]|nr:hypothetical protein [Candidatus Wallbacteria bacterium]